jgi:hypothetical protein
MTIEELLREAREIWGNDKLGVDEVLIRQGVTIGDLHRYARDKAEGMPVDEQELKKELGNVIFSTIRWCDDLGFSPEECIEAGKQSQIRYQDRKKS